MDKVCETTSESYLEGVKDGIKIATEQACKCYCDLICDKGRCGMCFIKNDGEGQVKNDFGYKGCLELDLIRNYIKETNKKHYEK